MQGCSCHFRKVLSRDRKINFNSIRNFTPRLIDQSQERASHPLFDMLCRHFNDAVIQLVHSYANGAVGLCREPVIGCRKFVPQTHRPRRREGFSGRHCGCGICVFSQCLRHAKQLPAWDMQRNNLLSVRCDPQHANITVQQQIEPVCVVAFFKNRSSVTKVT